jgi:heme/copper-type cytochrome/quinol oxidase subunit 3
MSGITRSAEMDPAGADRRRRTVANGSWGMALLIATEATLFGSLIATYFYLRFRTNTWPPEGTPKPDVTLPLIYTGMLIASAVPVFGAVRAAASGRTRIAWLLIAVALAVQGTYLGLQLDLYVSDFQDFRPDDNAYGSIYYTLLGVHHAHVAVGLALSLWLLVKLARGLTNYRLIGLRAIALYWYFVIVAGIATTLTVLYPSL